MVILLGIVIPIILNWGCAMYMAARQPEYTNMAVLHQGASRNEIIAELGPPILSEPKEDGALEEYYQFLQGYRKISLVIRLSAPA